MPPACQKVASDYPSGPEVARRRFTERQAKRRDERNGAVVADLVIESFYNHLRNWFAGSNSFDRLIDNDLSDINWRFTIAIRTASHRSLLFDRRTPRESAIHTSIDRRDRIPIRFEFLIKEPTKDR
jgi:hypothetical protein